MVCASRFAPEAGHGCWGSEEPACLLDGCAMRRWPSACSFPHSAQRLPCPSCSSAQQHLHPPQQHLTPPQLPHPASQLHQQHLQHPGRGGEHHVLQDGEQRSTVLVLASQPPATTVQRACRPASPPGLLHTATLAALGSLLGVIEAVCGYSVARRTHVRTTLATCRWRMLPACACASPSALSAPRCRRPPPRQGLCVLVVLACCWVDAGGGRCMPAVEADAMKAVVRLRQPARDTRRLQRRSPTSLHVVL